ncbi:MAG TPA: hypothetical protein VKS60_16810 [Stellaceae bacterium]|nr:hypothetical protein [Stellaceae bacterium]
MAEHKFKAGQSVELRGRMGTWVPPGPFSVVRPLPPEGRENQYRLKSKRDGHERVAIESDLAPLTA